MQTEMQDGQGPRCRSTNRRLMAYVGMLVAGLALSLASPALAAPPFSDATQATLLVGGTPLVEVRCPTLLPAMQAGGTSTNGNATATGGAMCGNAPAADVQGSLILNGATVIPGFSAGCQSSNGDNGGSVFVPVGTSINGGAPVGAVTAVSTANTPVVFPDGTTATLNVVMTTATSVTRSAIVLGSGTIIGRVICGAASVYPLAVDVSGASAPAAALAAPAASADASGPGATTLLLIGGFGVAVLAQLAVGRRIRRRRADATS